MDGWSFAKGHGTGNDFVIVPDPDGDIPLTASMVAALCDRRRGIGGDGILRVIRTASHPEASAMRESADWFMDYWNSDGSPAEICLNGLRVFARYLVDNSLAPAAGLQIATRAGVRSADVAEGTVTVQIPRPRVYADSAAVVSGRSFPGIAVDVGNPHLVCAVDDVTLAGLELLRTPETDREIFPEGTNIEFAVSAPAPAGADVYERMRVYERGSGETLSCGSGVVAVACVALRRAGRDTGVAVVDVPGGRLTVTLGDRVCQLTGPAVIVATGTLVGGRWVGEGSG